MKSKNDNKKLMVMVGHYASGKTTAARFLSDRYGGNYINHDIMRYMRSHDNDDFIKRINKIINKNNAHLYVVDGWGMPVNKLKDIDIDEIQVNLCFAAPHIIKQRQGRKNLKRINDNLPDNWTKIVEDTIRLSDSLDNTDYDVAYIDNTDGDPEIIYSKEGFMSRFRDRHFQSTLDEMTHDKYYQDIELPTMYINGYSKSRPSMDRIKSVMDFKDKSVIDIGCFHGYFLFQAEKLGASSITGLDQSEYAVKTACEIANINESKARFILSSIEDYRPDDVYDVCLCLNMLHHVSDIDNALRKIFLLAKDIVFEIKSEQQSILDEYAVMFGVLKCNVLNSHRRNRLIIKYQNPELYDYTGEIFTILPVLKKYQYNPQKEKMRSRIEGLKSICLRTAINLKRALYGR